MAQSDYIVSNGTGAAVRSDLNGQLAAIVSNNSGATAPATTYAYQWWADTTTNTLKLRNSANSAWIELRQLDGDFTTVSVDNGTAGSPSIYFNASGTDTGIFSSGTDAVDISTNGNRRFGIASGGDITVYGGNVTLNAQGDLRLADADSSNFIALQAPATISSNVTLTLPSADGSNGQVLTTNGSGTLSFTTPAATSDKITEGNTEAEVVDTGSDGHFKVTTEGTERFRCDNAGRVLVGTSTSTTGSGGAAIQQIAGTNGGGDIHLGIFEFNNNTDGAEINLGSSRGTSVGSFTVVQNGDTLGRIRFVGADGTNMSSRGAQIEAVVDGTPGSNDMPGRLVFSTTADGTSSPSERMRINAFGQTLIGKTSETLSTPGWCIDGGSTIGRGQLTCGSSGAPILRLNHTGGAGTEYAVETFKNGTQVGSISVTASATAYNTSSDYRLKENVTAVTDGITRLQQLKPSRFNFIADPDKTVDGFIAHEAQAVVPECVTGEKDAVDDEGNPIYQGIDQSKLVPLLTAALQEAVTKIESLEARLTAAGL